MTFFGHRHTPTLSAFQMLFVRCSCKLLYAKWLSICSAYCEFMLYFMCVEWNCRYFFLFHLSYSCLFLCCLLVLPYYMVKKDEYNLAQKNI